MVKEGIMLGYKISSQGIEVDKANIQVIKKLQPLKSVKGIEAFWDMHYFVEDLFKTFQRLQNFCVVY